MSEGVERNVTPEQQEQMELMTKIQRVNDTIGKILADEGLVLHVDHVIRLYPAPKKETK